MHVAFDIRPLARPGWTGIETYVFQLAAHLPEVLAADDRLSRFALSAGRRGALRSLVAARLPARANADTRVIPLPAEVLARIARRGRVPGLGLALGRPDLVHVSDSPVLRPSRTPLVATVFDLTPRLFPEQFPAPARQKFDAYFELVRRDARRILTTSRSAGRDVQAHLGVPEERISVTPLAADPRFRPLSDGEAIRAVRRRHGVPDRYAMFVGTLGPRKNLGHLLRAWARLPRRLREDIGLVLCGRPTRHAEELRGLAEELGVAPSVRFVGYLPFRDLHPLLCGAEVFVLPSVYEGFGLPVLEAMACGVPVIASDVASIPEVAGDAGLLVPADDPGALARELERLLRDRDLRASLRERGLRRSVQFTWAETARATLGAYRQALGGDVDHGGVALRRKNSWQHPPRSGEDDR